MTDMFGDVDANFSSRGWGRGAGYGYPHYGYGYGPGWGGFGFVEMADNEAARAIQELNGKDFDGRALRVNEAERRTAKRPAQRW